MGPYVDKRVKVISTSQEDLNGQQGDATSFDSDKGRYTVLMDSGKTVSLKPMNLETIPGELRNSRPAGMPAGMPGIPQGYEEAAKQAQMWLQTLQRNLPPGISPQMLVGGIAGLTVISIYILGFMKAILVLGILFSGLFLGFPEFRSSGGGLKGMRAAVSKLENTIIQYASTRTGFSISSMQARIIVVLLFTMMVGLVLGETLFRSVPDFSTPGFIEESAFVAYQKGFLSAENGEEYNNPYKDQSESVAESSSSAGYSMGNYVLKYIPLLMLGKTVYDLGGQPFDIQVAIANLQNVPTWKKMLMAIAVFRIIM